MPAAPTIVGADFKKRVYPVTMVEGRDMAEFYLPPESQQGFVGGGLGSLYIKPFEPDYVIAQLTLTDDDDNELEYRLDYVADRHLY